jgi:hypothetical protein
VTVVGDCVVVLALGVRGGDEHGPSARAGGGWTGPLSAGKITAVKYKSRRPRWIRIVVGLVVVFIVLAIVGAAIGR